MTSKAEFIKGTNFVETLGSSYDLDDLVGMNTSGFYLCNSPTNRPTGTGTGFLIQISPSSTVALQIFVNVNANTMYMRKLGSGTWTAWTSASFT